MTIKHHQWDIFVLGP